MEHATKILTVSSSAAYNLNLGFVPDYITVENMSSGEDVSELVSAYWYKDMGAGYYNGLVNQSTVTNGLIPVIGTTNGFTAYDSSNVAARQVLIDSTSGITQATNAVVTTAAVHGLSTGDKVSFQSIVDGMVEINGLSTTVTVSSTTEFSCDNIDSSSFTTWDTGEAGGMIIKTSDLNEDAGFRGVTLGTAIMATAADVLVINAWAGGNYAKVTQA